MLHGMQTNGLGMYNVLDFGAIGDKTFDNTQAFQAALNEAGKVGGIVYAPPGNYRFEGVLHVPAAVTLMGSFGAVPAHNGIRDTKTDLPKPGDFGTVLMPTAGRGSEEGAPFITLNTNSVLKGVLVYYPDQDPQVTPVPYPWTIAMRGKNPAVIDTELLNPYNGIDARGNERHIIRYVYGQPLHRGILIDGIYDIGRVENVHFNPWWSTSPAVIHFMVEEGIAFVIGKTDWEYMTNCFSIIYKIGFHFTQFSQGPGNVVLTQCGHDIAPYTAYVEHTQEHAGISFVNCQMMGEFYVAEANKGPIRINGCGFWGTGAGDFKNPGTPSMLTLNGTGHVILNGCHFTGWDRRPEMPGMPAIQANCRSVVINACDFLESKAHIHIGDKVQGAVVTGNHFNGKAQITGKLEAAQVGFNIETV